MGYLGGIELPELKGELVFRNVTFAYPGREDAGVLAGMNLTVPEGKVTAIVGPSGSGKSTVMALLLRFYDPTGGEITVDGRNLKEIDPKWLRKHIGTVSQVRIIDFGL